MLDWQFKTVTVRSTSVISPLENAAQQIQQRMNDEALKGWEFVQALPSDVGGYILIFRKPGSVGKGYADRADY